MVAGERPHRPSLTGEHPSRLSAAGGSLLVVPSALVAARAASGLSWREARRQVLDALVDEVEAADRAIAIAQARRIRAIEAVRVEAVGAVAALDPVLGPVDPADAVRISDIQAQQRYAHQSVVLEVSCAIRAPEVSTASLVHDAQVLVDHHPATLAALTDGSISYAHVGAVLENTTLLEPDDCRALEVALVDRAKDTTVAALRRFARRERERTHPRPLIERHGERLAERHVEIEPARDGMMWLHQYLPAVQAAAIYNRVTDIAASFQGLDEERTLAQLRADVLSALLLDDGTSSSAWESARSLGSADSTIAGAGAGAGVDAGAGAGAAADGSADLHARTNGPRPRPRPEGPSLRGIRATVAVTVPVMTLLGVSEEDGHLAGYGPIDAETARELAARAPSFRRLLTHPESGVVLSVGRESYRVPADLRAWLRIRDETCRFPGCNRRSEGCDVDHIAPWQTGGETDHRNLIHLCRHHHRIKHETAWSVSASDSGSADVFASPDDVIWTSPSGRTYVDHPAVPRPARLSVEPRPQLDLGAGSGPAEGGPEPSFPDLPPF
jgi:hypothetical protein